MTNGNLIENIKTLEKEIKQHAYRLTLTEAASITGLSIDESENSLREMINRYDCRLQVTDSGDIIYDFGSSLHRRGAKTFQERIDNFLELLWKGFTIFFKAWIAVTLVLYFAIFAVILLVIIFNSGDSDRDDRRSRSIVGPEVILHLFLAIFEWKTVTNAISYERDSYGYQYRQYQPKPSPWKKSEKNFIASVYDFVFGPPRVELDSLENQKEVATYLRMNKGIFVASELKALAGWNSSGAALFFSDCIARFQGDIKVSPNGIMYGQFDRLLRNVGKENEGRIVYYWDEYEPEYKLTGNSSFNNSLVIFLNSFNLIGALFIIFGGIPLLSSFGIILGLIPLMFSILFFGVPLLRFIKLRSEQQKRHLNNIRKRILKAIFEVQGKPQNIETLLSRINSSSSIEEPLSKEITEKMLDKLLIELPGDIRTSDQGEVFYEFPIITFELEEVKKIRSQKNVETTLGNIVFDSEK